MKSLTAAIAALLTLLAGALVTGCGGWMPTRLPDRPCADREIRTDISVYSLHPGTEGFSGVPFTLRVSAEGLADFPGVTLLDDFINPDETNTHTRIGYRSWWTGRDNEPHEATHTTPWELAVICYPRAEPSRIRVSATYTLDDGPDPMMTTYDSIECVIDDEYVNPNTPDGIRVERQLELLDLVKTPDLETGRRQITATCDYLYVPDGWTGELPHELPAAPRD
jgi:hypothetical protein